MNDTDNMDDKNLLQEYNTSEIYRRKQVKQVLNLLITQKVKFVLVILSIKISVIQKDEKKLETEISRHIS